MALASGLLMAVFCVKTQTQNAFTGGPVGFDAVLGARGSQLQLVLNTVFHLETSPGNIPWSMYQTIKKKPAIELAIPFAVGDNYRGFRIVGTTDEIFSKFEYHEGHKFTLRQGKFFDLERQEAVLGSFVAQKTGLRINDTFNPYHGLATDETARHDDEYRVVGILEPTNTPSDRVIWIPLEGIHRLGGHVLHGSGKEYVATPEEAIPDEEKEVSAVMLKFTSPQVGFILDQEINSQGRVATLAWPIGRVMSELFDKIGWLDRVLALVAYLVAIVAAGSILASIYNTMNERRREFAILRALGARRATVFSVVVLEAMTIAAFGSLCGFVVYGIIMSATAYILRTQVGVALEVWQWHPSFIAAPLGMLALGAASGVIPALNAYSADVATNLSSVS